MPLKNYSTKVPANRSIAEIQEMLTKRGVTGLMFNYEQGTGRIESLIFKIEYSDQVWGFKLPIKWRQAQKKMIQERNSKARDDDYAYRVAWRIVRNWLEQQMALLDIEMVDMTEIFLPYAVQKNGQTLFENIIKDPKFLLKD